MLLFSGVDAGQVEDDFFGFGLDVLRDLELLFGLGGLVLDRVELAEDHAVFDALGLEGDDLLELGDGQIEGIAGRRRGRDRVLLIAELA